MVARILHRGRSGGNEVAATVVAIRDHMPREERIDTTLLALVQAVAEVAESEREVVATVVALLRSGRVRLTGTFRNAPLSSF
jgi:hypothetical protein